MHFECTNSINLHLILAISCFPVHTLKFQRLLYSVGQRYAEENNANVKYFNISLIIVITFLIINNLIVMH